MNQRTTLTFDDAVGYQLRLTHRIIKRHLAQKIQSVGITIGMWYFLQALWDEDGLTQRELSEKVGTMEPTTLAALKSMERNGLVRRVRNADDKRKVNVYVTDKGQALKEQVLPLARDVTETATAGFSTREQETLIQLLQAIQQNFVDCERK